MFKLSFAEKIARAFSSGSVPDIKGKTKITLTDPRTGAREVFQDENMVTAAITRIMNSNYLGLTDYYNLIPIKQLFGGVFCFSQALTEDANNMWPANNSISAMTANAGQTPYSGTSSTRGNPEGSATEITGDHIKFVWSWGLSQGNGPISCVCLTHQEAGDCGLLPDGTLPLLKSTGLNLPGVNHFSAADLGDGNLTRARCIAMPIKLDNDGNGISLYCDGTTLEEITVVHSFVTACLLEPVTTAPLDSTNYREVGSRTATLSRTFDAGYTFMAQDETNYYVMERDSSTATTLYVDVISKSDMSVTPLTLSGLTETLARPSASNPARFNGIVSGGSVYWVSGSDAKTFVRVNLATPADTEVLASSLASNISLQQTPVCMSDGLVMGRNFLINASNVYPIIPRTRRSGSTNETLAYDILAMYKNGPHILQSGNQNDNTTYNRSVQGGVLALPYLATINNLATPVTKTNSKAMQIEYTLTEV